MREVLYVFLTFPLAGLYLLIAYLFARKLLMREAEYSEWKIRKIRLHFAYFESRTLFRVLYSDKKGLDHDRICYISLDGLKWRDDLS